MVVVTHAPILAIALHRHEEGAAESIDYGQVIDYEPGSWENPDFDASLEYLLDQKMQQ